MCKYTLFKGRRTAEFEASLGYVVSQGSLDHRVRPFLKKTKQYKEVQLLELLETRAPVIMLMLPIPFTELAPSRNTGPLPRTSLFKEHGTRLIYGKSYEGTVLYGLHFPCLFQMSPSVIPSKSQGHYLLGPQSGSVPGAGLLSVHGWSRYFAFSVSQTAKLVKGERFIQSIEKP